MGVANVLHIEYFERRLKFKICRLLGLIEKLKVALKIMIEQLAFQKYRALKCQNFL